MTVEAIDQRPVFVGIGRTDDVADYLRGVRYAELTHLGHDEPDYDLHPGGAPKERHGIQGLLGSTQYRHR